MNEEQAVLDFFANPENLQLTLRVAELADTLRQEYNNRFWRSLHAHVGAAAPEWSCALTEDRQAPGNLIGLSLTLSLGQEIFLRPFLEQQVMGGTPRIYGGLMWSVPPSPEQNALPAVAALRETLQTLGYKQSETFPAWRWTLWHPRRRDFLLQFAKQPEALTIAAGEELLSIVTRHRALLDAAHAALAESPRSATISLAQLRSNPGKSSD